jgi:hypothetical protein
VALPVLARHDEFAEFELYVRAVGGARADFGEDVEGGGWVVRISFELCPVFSYQFEEQE